MPSYSVRQSRKKEFKEVAGAPALSDSTIQKILEDNNWEVQSALNHFFNNRHRYKEVKQGKPTSLKKIFDGYKDPDDDEVMSEEGMLKFFKDVGVNPEGVDTLAIAWHLSCEEVGLISKDEFVNGFAKAGCSSTSDIKSTVKQVGNKLKNDGQFKQFYKWIFHHVKEDDKKKTIPAEMACELWKIVLSSKKRDLPLLEQWIKFVSTSEETKAVSRDVWEQSFDFLKETKSVDEYDDNGAWPVAVDEFVEWMGDQKK